jgi:uncharacterized protein (TIGR00255 family)
MAVYSMTGFASATAGPSATAQDRQDSTTSRTAVTVELRSVNGRFFDLSLRLPDELRSLEPVLRDAVASVVRRGKVELRAVTQRDTDGSLTAPGSEQLSRLARLEAHVQTWLPGARALSVYEVLQCSRPTPAIDDELQAAAVKATRECAQALRDARAREGARLVAVLTERVQQLRALAVQAAPLVPALVQRQQQRFIERWNEALVAAGGSDAESPRERALSEAAAFALRVDVAEELARLTLHLDEIDRLLAAGGEVGKRLDFLIQELHREANTLGSKSATLELTNIAVDMKVLIEQLREQVQNVE